MVIKVNGVRDEYEFLKQNPHVCGDLQTGDWTVTTQILSPRNTDVLDIKCKACGTQKKIEFDFGGFVPAVDSTRGHGRSAKKRAPSG